jgi:hypothetical protein
MKMFMLVIFSIHCTIVAVFSEEYETKYDNINLDDVLGNNRLLTNYVKCLMSEGPCTPDGSMLKSKCDFEIFTLVCLKFSFSHFFKANLPDAIETGCEKCSEKQREGSRKVIRYIIDNRPEDWVRIEVVYDPEGTYRAAYLKQKALDARLASNLTSADKQ